MSPQPLSSDEFFNWSGPEPPSRDTLLNAIRDHTAGEFEVFGEMGRGANGRIVYLARWLTPPGSLVALRLDPSEEPNKFHFDRLETLDSSVPATGLRCPRAACGALVPGWGRFCPFCAMDLSGLMVDPGEWGPGELLEAVREFAHGQYDVLGHMPRADGGGFVYFARDQTSGEITALRLQRAEAGRYQLGLTGVLPRIAREVDNRHPPVPEVSQPPIAPPPPARVHPPGPETRFNLPPIDPESKAESPVDRTRPNLPRPAPEPIKPSPPPPPRPGTMVGKPRAPTWQEKVQSLTTDPRFAIALMGLVVVLLLIVLFS